MNKCDKYFQFKSNEYTNVGGYKIQEKLGTKAL